MADILLSDIRMPGLGYEDFSLADRRERQDA
jgi:hypothetical protein